MSEHVVPRAVPFRRRSRTAGGVWRSSSRPRRRSSGRSSAPGSTSASSRRSGRRAACRAVRRTVPLVLALVLAATSVPVQLSLRSARAGRVAAARRLLLLAVLVQAGYFAMQTSLIEDDLAKFTPQESAYGSIYYTMLGAHQAHVALGILLELWLLAQAAPRPDALPARRPAVDGALLALRQPARAARRRSGALGPRMNLRRTLLSAEFLQWFGSGRRRRALGVPARARLRRNRRALRRERRRRGRRPGYVGARDRRRRARVRRRRRGSGDRRGSPDEQRRVRRAAAGRAPTLLRARGTGRKPAVRRHDPDEQPVGDHLRPVPPGMRRAAALALSRGARRAARSRAVRHGCGTRAATARRNARGNGAPTSTPRTACAATGTNGAGRAEQRTVAAQASARRPPTSTSAPATCRLPRPANSPHRTDVQFSPARDRRARGVRRLARPRAAGAEAASGPRQPGRGSAALHRALRRLPSGRRPRRLREGRRRAFARPGDPDADRRGGADRAVPDAAASRRSRSPTRQLDSIVAYVRYAQHPDDAGGWPLGHLGPVPEGLVTWLIAAAALVAVCMVIGGGGRRRAVNLAVRGPNGEARRRPTARRLVSAARWPPPARPASSSSTRSAVPHRTQFLGLSLGLALALIAAALIVVRQAARPARGARGGLPAAAGARAGRGGDRELVAEAARA